MTTPLSPADLLKLVHDDLAAFATAAGARLVIAPDALLPLEMLLDGPAGLLIALHWGGEQPAEEQAGNLAVVAHKLVATVGHKLPHTAKPNLGLMETLGERKALLARVAEVRNRIFSLIMPAEVTDGQWRYAGTEPVELAGHPLSAYRISFELDAAMAYDTPRTAVWPPVVPEPEEPEAPPEEPPAEG